MSYGVGYTCALQYSCIQETVQIAWTINTKNSEKKTGKVVNDIKDTCEFKKF